MKKSALIAFFTIFLICLTPAVHGEQQFETQLFYNWNKLAEETEKLILKTDVNVSELKRAQFDLSVARKSAYDQELSNSGKVENLAAELEIIGLESLDIYSESYSVAKRRDEVKIDLERFRAQMLAARLAKNRLEVLSTQIDDLISDKMWEKVFTLGESPLNPKIWPVAGVEFSNIFEALADEFQSVFSNELKKTSVLNKLPLVVFLIAISLILSVLLYRRVFYKFALAMALRKDKVLSAWFYVSINLFRLVLSLGVAFLILLALKKNTDFFSVLFFVTCNFKMDFR